MTMLLELRQVWKIYGAGPARVQALRDIDLAVEGGELVAVMGPSGSGKTTLLAIAGSLEEPSSGEVLVSGSALSGMTPNQRARLRRRAIGYVFQDFNLLAGLSAVENVALPLELDGVGQRAARASGLPVRAGWPRWTSWAWPIRPAGSPTSCQAVSANGSRSPARWWASGACCWPTSRPAPWTRSMASR
jgi:predicted ABC-type transport system involved in lysophospholipase L1 biosynthesis ATPase subunit